MSIDTLPPGPEASTSSPKVPLSSKTPADAPTPPVTLPAESVEDEILRAVASKDVDALKRLAAGKGGFRTNELRKEVWPLLLGLDGKLDKGKGRALEQDAELEPHKDEGQVRLDVNRSFITFPKNVTSAQKKELQEKLQSCIAGVLRRHVGLHYFQGYHDIVSVILLTLVDEDLSLQATEKMSLHRIRDSMTRVMEPIFGYLRLLKRILQKADPALAGIVDLTADLPFFSLSWVLTLMSHDLTQLEVIQRLFDFLLASNPAMIAYLGVAIIQLKVEAIGPIDQDVQDDPALLHHALCKLPVFVLDTAEEPPAAATPRGGAEEEEEEDDEDLLSNLSPSTYDLVSSSSITHSISSISSDDLDSSVVSLPPHTPSRSRRNSWGSSGSYGGGYNDKALMSPDADSNIDFDAGASMLRDATPSPPSPAASQEHNEPGVSVEELIDRAAALWERYPLVGDGGIDAQEVMGPKSCVFTWEGSVDGTVSDADADVIASTAQDDEIVIPPPAPPTPADEDAIRTERERRRREQKQLVMLNRQRSLAAFTVVGIVGVLLAMYGQEFFAASSSSKSRWWTLGLGMGLRWPLQRP